MKKIILLLFFTLVYSQEGISQNTFFIGEKMYPCTETFTLTSNSKNYTGYDLDVLIAKNGQAGFIVVSTERSSVFIKGKLVIYLEDGTIISCTDIGIYDYVDNTATTVYYLTNAEIEKMKMKNINTIRFSLKCGKCTSSSEEGNYSVSNNDRETGFGIMKREIIEKIDFPSIIEELFD